MKVKNKKPIKKNEFRKNRTTNHPAYIYEQQGHDVKFISITHSAKTHHADNIALDKNPNPKDPKQAFILPNPNKEKLNHFKSKEKNWSFAEQDKAKVNAVKLKPIKNDRRSSRLLDERRCTDQKVRTAITGQGKQSSRSSQRSKTSVAKIKAKVKEKKS